MMPRQTSTKTRIVRHATFGITTLVLTIMLACGTSTPGTLVTPTITPGSTIFFGVVDVAMTTTTTGAEIHYTTDGSTPTATHGVPYAGSFPLSKSATVRAAAYLSGGATSDVSSATYVRTGHTMGIWGSSTTNVWAVGGYYDFMTLEAAATRYDGSNWSSSAVPADASILMSVWSSAPNDVFAVGLQGTIVHFDGATWATMASGTIEDLYGVWGSAWNDVFAVGGGGTILHYTGASWSAMTSPTTNELRSVYGVDSSHIMAVGASGTVVTYGGAVWALVAPAPTPNDLHGAWAGSATNAYAVGSSGTIIHYNGAWTTMVSGSTLSLKGVWGVGSEVFAVGEQGAILYYNGATWAAMASGTTNPLQSVWGGLASDDVFAVGVCGTILHFNGTTWSPPWGGGGKCAG
jgi:hypothetical protein